MRTAIPFTILPIDDATTRAAGVLRLMGRATFTERELSVLAREIQQVHGAGRQSMYRSIAEKLGLHVPPGRG